MTLKAFIADRIITDGVVFEKTALLTDDGRSKGLVPLNDIPTTATRITLGGLTLAPALVDAQANGGGGVLFNDSLSVPNIKQLVTAHQRAGTAALLPTLITDDLEKIDTAINVIREFRQNNGGVMGLHLEGPFLNPARSGIHEKNKIQKANADFLNEKNLSGLGVLFITLAPEMFDAGGIKKLSALGAIIAAGHSAADATVLENAKAEGLRGITHLFNAMGGMSAREAGLSGLALDDADLWCSIIADGAHVAPAMLRLAEKAKPTGKLFFVSDAMPPAGETPPNTFILQGKTISVRDKKCVDATGALAGSAMTLFECVRWAVQHAGLSIEKALAMASLYPAQCLNVSADYGSLSTGHRADIIAFDDTMKLEKVFMGGQLLNSF
jgi:N-acetylglucosamine-6-phosphate deacetylase